MSPRVLFSVIIVSYNAGDKLLTTLRSVLSQQNVTASALADFRVVIKDGASTDGSIVALERELTTYPETLRQRVQILRGKDKGIYDAMNEALDAVLGSVGHAEVEPKDDTRHLLYFINCGDTLASEDVLERVAKAFLSAQVKAPAIVYGDVVEDLTKQRVSSNPKIDAFACYRHVPNHQACFYEAALFARERFDTSLRVRADYDHFLKSFFNYHAVCHYLPFLIAHYEGGGFSETAENRKRSAKEHRLVAKRYFSEEEIRRYDLRLRLTLQPLRTRLAENQQTARAYQAVKRTLYRVRQRGAK